jgi:hypothetical protein
MKKVGAFKVLQLNQQLKVLQIDQQLKVLQLDQQLKVLPKTIKLVFVAKYAALRRKSIDLLAWNQDSVSKWNDMSIRRLLFQ